VHCEDARHDEAELVHCEDARHDEAELVHCEDGATRRTWRTANTSHVARHGGLGAPQTRHTLHDTADLVPRSTRRDWAGLAHRSTRRDWAGLAHRSWEGATGRTWRTVSGLEGHASGEGRRSVVVSSLLACSVAPRSGGHSGEG
jgi:hypothetical protein